MVRCHRDLVVKQAKSSHWGSLRLDNRVRLQVYLDTPIDYSIGLGEFWACRYWAPPWDADFFFSRQPATQAFVLTALRPALWSQGIWDERFELLWELLTPEVAVELSLELCLALGRYEQAESLLTPALKRKGYDLPLLRGPKAYQRALKLVSRRKPGIAALPPLVAVFAPVSYTHLTLPTSDLV